MDNARKKLRVCLICVVMAAVIIGLIYYMNDVVERGSMDEGTLVYHMDEGAQVSRMDAAGTVSYSMDVGRDSFTQEPCWLESRG